MTRAFIALAMLGSAACAHSMYVPVIEGTSYPATNSTAVQLYASSSLPRPYQLVGFVTANGRSVNDAVIKLRQRVASMGGDAVVAVELTTPQLQWAQVSGAVVRFQ